MDIHEFVSRLDGVKKSGSGYIARCPAHDDNRQSLSVSVGKDNKIVLHCHVGCDTQSILSTMGLSMTDLFPERTKSEAREIIYQYHDADGKTLYQKIKRPDKSFTQRRSDGNSGWIYNRKGIPPTLYNLPAVLQADTVFVAEGEKDADTLNALGLVGTTGENGAGPGKWKPEYTEALRGKTVYVLFDNDEVGRAYGEETAAALVGVAESVKLLDLKLAFSQLPEHGDISDVVKAAGEAATIKALTLLIETTPEYMPTVNPIKDKPQYNPAGYAHTDIGAGNLFADVYGDSVRYTPDARSMFFLWDGRQWLEDIKEQVNELAKDVAARVMPQMASAISDDKDRIEWLKWAGKMQSNQLRRQMLESARTKPGIASELAEFDRQSRYVNLQNGVYDLEGNCLLPHDKKYMLSKMAGAAYNPSAKCKRWEQFVFEIMGGDNDSVKFLQKAIGYSFMGDPVEDCLFVLYGEKTRNGKSTLCRTIMHVYGDYGCTAQPETIAIQRNKNSNAPSSDVARLRGARFVNMPEPDKGMELNGALVKQLTGRDPIAARFMHREHFEFVPGFVLFMNTNYLPRIDDITLFTSGRVFCIPFPVHFEESQQDKNLLKTFTTPEAASAILNWIIEGYRLYKLEGLKGTAPEAIQAATQVYQVNSDTFGQFIADCITPCENGFVSSSDIYREYEKWTQENGHRAMSNKNMSMEFERRGYFKKRNNTGQRGFTNILILKDIPSGW